MAILENSMLNGLRGRIGKELVFKKWGDKTIATKYPSFNRKQRKKKLTELKKLKEGLFRSAMDHAKEILRDPQVKASYKAKAVGMQTAFNVVVQEYMNNAKTGGINPG